MKPNPTVQELLFDVDQVAIEAVVGSNGSTRRISIPGKKALVNRRTGLVLGVVGRDYRVVTNQEAINLARDVCQQVFPGLSSVEWEAMRAAAPGTLSYAFIDLVHQTHVLNYMGTEIGEDDPFTPFLRVTNSFNGARALRFDIGFMREHCSNGVIFEEEVATIKASHSKEALAQLKIEITLMQMGRWFGYRDGHADLCRIFMAPEAASWYAHISEATEELRRDFKSMERARLTPKDFGLRVRSHPASLIVTARNKMRTGKLVPMQIALEGRLAATSIVFGDKDSLDHNGHVLSSVCEQSEAEVTGELKNLGYIWKDVSPSIIVTAIRNFRNHPECMLTYPDPLVQYIEWLATQQGKSFDVLLRSVKGGVTDYPIGSWNIAPITRTVETLTDKKITFNKRRVGSKGDESAGLSPREIEEVRNNYPGKNVPDCEYRKVKDRNPLFLIYFARVNTDGDKLTSKTVPAFGVSFPGDPGSARRPAKLVEYVVTTKWWEQNYGQQEDEPEENDV